MTTTNRSVFNRLAYRALSLVAVSGTALTLALATPVLAQGQQGTKIGFVNTERILRDSAPAKAAQTKIENEFKKRAEELEKQVNNLRSRAQQLEKDAPVLSESERNKRQRELANLDADLQRKRREIQEDSSRRRNEEFATIIEKANAAIKKIAEQESYDIVIQDAVTVNPRVDITDKVIQALGK
ncbi:MAG: OmpH family outer membrane protein [Zwartia sp.]